MKESKNSNLPKKPVVTSITRNRDYIIIIDSLQTDEIISILNIAITNEKVIAKDTVWESLDFIQDSYTTTGAIPKLIILNMKMPELNGADFLEAFQYLPLPIRVNCEIIVFNGGECEKNFNYVMQFPMILHYNTGPFSRESVSKIFVSLVNKNND